MDLVKRWLNVLILLWWGIFLASTPVLEGAEWLVIIGPIFLTFLLLFVSGIPLHEDSADKKFGNVDGYRIYKTRTSPLIPLPPSVYGNLPAWFKKALLLEFPFYNRNLPQEENWYGFSKEVVECPAGYEPLESIVRSISTTGASFELKNCSDDCVPLVMGDSCVFLALDLYQVVKAKSRSICPQLKKKMV